MLRNISGPAASSQGAIVHPVAADRLRDDDRL